MLLASGAWATKCDADTGAGEVGNGQSGKQMVILFVDMDRPSGQPPVIINYMHDGSGGGDQSTGSWQKIVNVDYGASVRATNPGAGTIRCYYKLSLMGKELDVHTAGQFETCQAVWHASQS
jgi:hypothetical protein